MDHQEIYVHLYNKKYILLLIFFLSINSVLNAQPTTPEELKDELAQAINTKNKEELTSLFYWEGIDDEMRKLSERNINQLIEFSPQKIELIPLPEDFKTEFVRNGIKYRPNVKLIGIIKIKYGDEGPDYITDTKIPYGVKDGIYYLPNTVTEKTGYEGPGDKTININVIGTSAPDPVLFEGFCLYNVSGVEKKKFIKGEGNLSEAFWGQGVSSCSIKRLSDSGSLKLIISVGGKTIFESEMEETPKITYP